MSEVPFRLAIRTEGNMVNCYYAKADTMEDAILLSSIHRKIFDADPTLVENWKTLMTASLDAMCKHLFGHAPRRYIEEEGPEHERPGNA